MHDYEGSRSEFLSLLASFGEEPAFIARALAPEVALKALRGKCEVERKVLLRWPTLHISALAALIGCDWHRLRPLLVVPESVNLFGTLHASMSADKPVQTGWFTSDKVALQRFLQSAERFNRKWKGYVESLDLESVNKPRRDFNKFYAMELACAFGTEIIAENVEHLAMIDDKYLYACYPFLMLPTLA